MIENSAIALNILILSNFHLIGGLCGWMTNEWNFELGIGVVSNLLFAPRHL